MAADCGAGCVQVATHGTEADVSEQHIGLGRQLGLDTVGFLMMAHMTPVDAFVLQALLMEGYGAQTVYCTDSARSEESRQGTVCGCKCRTRRSPSHYINKTRNLSINRKTLMNHIYNNI